jgi:hypothetical protein
MTLFTSNVSFANESLLIPNFPNSSKIEKFLNTTNISRIISPANDFDLAAKNIKEKFQCKDGKKRLTEDSNFFVSSDKDKEVSINGSFQSGFLMSGKITKIYAGHSAYNDLLFVTEVRNEDNKLLGHNVTVSFCEVKNPYKEFPNLVSNDRQLTDFQAPYGITTIENECGVGNIIAIYTSLISRAKPNDIYTHDFPAYTSFVGVDICDNKESQNSVFDEKRDSKLSTSTNPNSEIKEKSSDAVSK